MGGKSVLALNIKLDEITTELIARSQSSRQAYLSRIKASRDQDPPRQSLSCGNLAHAYAACSSEDKQTIRLMQSANIGIVNAYNDILSAHQPLAKYPDIVKQVATGLGSSAQVAGGVPAMCDGVTQGRVGMELSLFSRDVIAMATAVSLTHNVFDAALCLGTCDKIVPGMLIGALQFGHLPVAFFPAGPMPSGISNLEKAKVRQRFAEGKATREELLDAESASYHSAGTCTFYGTANTNQVLMEILGVQLPGASFVNPQQALRQGMLEETTRRLIKLAESGAANLADVVTEKSIMNALVVLLATGGSTNHTIHLVAIARAAGIQLSWKEFDAVSKIVPLLVRIYPNGSEDINAFQRAGGTAFLFRELRQAGFLHDDVKTIMGEGLEAYEYAPSLSESNVNDHNGSELDSSQSGKVCWQNKVTKSAWPEVLSPISKPIATEGGLRLITGNLGNGIVKVSAVKPEHRYVKAPCRIFNDQTGLKIAFEAGELDRDLIAVVRFQGPTACGMPELHQLTPYLGVLQDRGFKVALVTDGRMSGASGKVPAAIHLAPEAYNGGPLARLLDGDVIELDSDSGALSVEISAEEFQRREVVKHEQANDTLGRNLFSSFRSNVDASEMGASIFRF
jgi:phosphogluconate dehydratase